MMAVPEDRREDPAPGLKTLLLAVAPIPLGALALVAFSGVLVTVSRLMARKISDGALDGSELGKLLVSLLVCAGATWALLRLRPSQKRTGTLAILLVLVAAMGLLGTGGIVHVLLANKIFWRPEVWVWPTQFFLVWNLLIAAAGIVGLLRLRPWKGWDALKPPFEPVSPATRRSNKLYVLKEGLAGVATLVLIFGAFSFQHPMAAFSNSRITPWVAVVAGLSWLVARVLREWWRNSSDEHEQRASDTGRNAAAGVFFAVTPAWWLGWRAGFLPQPDAMVLWMLAMLVSTFGWSWRRYN
jgi:hypothetical protein